MHLKSLSLALLLLVGSVALGVSSHIYGLNHRSDAAWLLTRASAEASAYPETFDGRHIDTALGTLGERRAQMGVALRFDLLRALGGIGAGAAILWLYGLFLVSRLKPIGATVISNARDAEIATAVARAQLAR